MMNNILVHNEAVKGCSDFVALPIYTFKFALDQLRVVDTVEHREGLKNEAMGYMVRTGDTTFRFVELGDLNNYKSVKF